MLRSALAGLALASLLPAQAVQTFYTLTNDATDNEVVVGVQLFGRVFEFNRFSTGGTGTAAGLGSQAALAASDDWRYLAAVNPDSDDVALFRVFGGLWFYRTDVESTGGDRPTSVDIRDDLLYVLNADTDDVSGFRIARGGDLQPLGRYPLSGAGVAAAQVGFSPSGRHLVVTERATDQITVFPVQRDGTLGAPTVNPSAGQTPFGFAFRDDGTLIVSDAAGGAAGASTVSSYGIRGNGSLAPITAALATTQSAACWIAIPRGGRDAYATNTASGTISGMDVDRQGHLSLQDPNGTAGTLAPNARPIDFAFDRRGRYLFTLDAGNDEIVVFRRRGDGSLRLEPQTFAVPDGAAGVLAR